MPTYTVEGPVLVPTRKAKVAKVVDREALGGFWEYHGDVANRRGCYIFAIRSGRGIMPLYVGKATKTFRQEVFALHKLEKYGRALADCRKGNAVLFFLVAPASKGATNLNTLRELEDFLIQTAVARNPNILNVRGTKRENWAIAGVVRGGVGKPSHAARDLRRALRISRTK